MGLSLLVVDDDEGTRYVVKRELRRIGRFHLHEAESAEEAMRLLGERLVDVILTDFRMAGRTGVDLLCHALERHPGVGRVLMSGTLDEARLQEASWAACVHHAFEKPMGRDGWEPALRKALHAVERARAGSATDERASSTS